MVDVKKDNVALVVEFSGRREEVQGKLEAAFAPELTRKTGLKLEDVTLHPETKFVVTLRPIKEGAPYTGESTVSVEDAVIAASNNGEREFNQNAVSVRAERVAEAPYFTVPVTVRSISKEVLTTYHGAAVEQLASTYSHRLNPQPDSIRWRVVHTSARYANDRTLPSGDSIQGLVASGESGESIEDAARLARPPKKQAKKVHSTFYEQTAQMMVYGLPEKSLAAAVVERPAPVAPVGRAAAVAAAPAIVTASKVPEYRGRRGRCGRGASPAGREPLYSTPAISLM